MEIRINEFSVICRILGTLFNRSPEDPVIKPLFELIMQDQLKLSWPLEQDELLTQLAASSQDLALVIKDFKQLFLDPTSAIADSISQYSEISATAVKEFYSQWHTAISGKADRFAALLLAASWLEDNAVQGSVINPNSVI